MEQLWNFLNPAGFIITALGLFYGYLSYRSGKDTTRMIEESRIQFNRSMEQSQKMIEESRNQLSKSIDQSQRMIEESRRSTQEILTAWHSRWEQSDEFNKRLLERILDKVH